ncbi:MAG: hypothetical protein JWP81_225 [Ferruginibacter sp.]|nr:hypothetical protein [Ferruginibacter sp.]
MHELITRLTEKAGISTEQATKALETIKDFVIEKFPMMAGAVDNLFASEEASTTAATTTAGDTTAVIDPEAPKVEEPTLFDKISDVLPGETGQKVEDFVKGAAHKAEDVFGDVKEKLSGMFGGEKK